MSNEMNTKMKQAVERTLQNLNKRKDSINSLIVIADTDDAQMVQIAVGGVTRGELMALVATLELIKADIVDTIRSDDNSSEDEPPSLTIDDGNKTLQ